MPETTPALTDWWDPWDVYQALARAEDRIRELEAENRMLRGTLDEVWGRVQDRREGEA